MKNLAILATLTPCAVSSAMAATVYQGDAVIDDAANIPFLSTPPWSESGRVFTLTQSPNGFLVAKVITVTTGTEFGFQALSIAGSYGIFSVAQGAAFTYQNAKSNPSLLSWSTSFPNTLTLTAGQSAYIGYWSQLMSNSTPEPVDIFGWAKVTVSGGNLTVEESASAQGGIIVGTLTAIPEPSSLLLISSAALPLLRRRRHASVA